MSASFQVSLDQIDKLNDLLASAAGIVHVSALAVASHSDEMPKRAPLNASLHAARLIEEALAIVLGINKSTERTEVTP